MAQPQTIAPELHRLLKRQLRRLGIDPALGPADAATWNTLLERINRSYEQADNDRYTLERSLDVSSREMQSLYEALRAASESRLAEERDRLNAVIASVGDGLCLLDPDNCIRMANPESANLLGGSLEQIEGMDFFQLTGLAGDGELVRSAVIARQPYRANEDRCRQFSGGDIPVSYVVNPVLRGDQLLGSVVVFRDISEQKRVEERLREARDAAHQASRAKSEFLSRMSHELRTPLHAILGFAELLEIDCDPRLSVKQREYLAHILNGGRHLLELISEVLDLARIESGRLEVSLDEVDTTRLLSECLELIAPLAAERRIQIDSAVPGTKALHVRADYRRLKQVFLNLLSNAVKYNHEGGEVLLIWAPVPPDRLRIGVRDTGQGLTPEQLTAVFEPFNRLKYHDGAEGAGIGLTITRRLLALMEGQVHAESEPGIGSTFWVDLPRARTAPDMLVEKPKTEPVSFNPRATVLCVEDNPANLLLVKAILRRNSGIRLLSAKQAKNAIELVRSEHPQLVLLDINLPGMDGFEALQRIRALEGMHNLPVVALSANALPREVQRGLDAGFDRYLTKPVDVQAFLQVLDEVLGGS